MTQIRYEASPVPYTASADHDPGEIVQLPDGRAGIIPAGGVKSGETVGVEVGNVIVKSDAVSAGAISAGDVVEWDSTNKQIVADTAGDFDAGKAFDDKADGTDEIEFVLNLS